MLIIPSCYQIMQGTLPILPTDQALLRSLLAQVLDGTRSAFSSSLGCFVRATSPGKGEVDLSQIKTAAGLFGQAEFEPPSTAKSLILIATAMFLALATEALGPAPSHGGASPSSRDWLSRANGIANNIKIHMKPSPQKLTEGAGDTEAKFARRLYVALFIMDKRLAIAYATPQLISASGLTLIAEDRNLLGQQCYYLARKLLRRLVETFAIPDSTSYRLIFRPCSRR